MMQFIKDISFHQTFSKKRLKKIKKSYPHFMHNGFLAGEAQNIRRQN